MLLTYYRYEEVCKPGYTFGSKQPASGTLHFTQLVWKASTELGMGVAEGKKDGMNCFYAVARYRVRGNMGGEYVKNVAQGIYYITSLLPRSPSITAMSHEISHYFF